MWVACIAHSLVVMLAVVLIKRELHNLDGRLSIRYDTRKGMEPLAGLAAPSETVRGFNQGQFARSQLLWLSGPTPSSPSRTGLPGLGSPAKSLYRKRKCGGWAVPGATSL